MTTIISVTIKGRKELIRKLEKLKVKNPAKMVCKEFAQELVINMKSIAPYWTGALQKSIQSRMTRDGYNIHTIEYAGEVEYGHGPVQDTERIWAWAEAKSTAPASAVATLMLKGAVPHPFVEPALRAVEGDFDRIAKATVNRAFKECGLR